MKTKFINYTCLITSSFNWKMAGFGYANNSPAKGGELTC